MDIKSNLPNTHSMVDVGKKSKLNHQQVIYDSISNSFCKNSDNNEEYLPEINIKDLVDKEKRQLIDNNIIQNDKFKKLIIEHEIFFNIDELISYIDTNYYHIIAAVVSATTTFQTFTQFETLPIIIGLLSNDPTMNFQAEHRNILNILEQFTRIISCLGFGILSDIYGRWRITAQSSILCLIFAILTVFSPSSLYFLIFRSFQSCMTQGQFLVDLIYLQEIVVPNKRVLFVGYIFLTQGISYFFVNIIWWVVDQNWRLFLIITLVPQGVSCILRVTNFESTKWLNRAGQYEDVCEISTKNLKENQKVQSILIDKNEIEKIKKIARKRQLNNLNPIAISNDQEVDPTEDASLSSFNTSKACSVVSEYDKGIDKNFTNMVQERNNLDIHLYSQFTPSNKHFQEVIIMVLFHFGLGFSHFSIASKILPFYLISQTHVTIEQQTQTHSWSSMAVPVQINIAMIVTLLIDKRATQIMNIFINVQAMFVLVNGHFTAGEQTLQQSLVSCTQVGLIQINTAMRVEYFPTNVRCMAVCFLEVVTQVFASVALIVVDLILMDSQIMLNLMVMSFSIFCFGSMIQLNSNMVSKSKKDMIVFDYPLIDDDQS